MSIGRYTRLDEIGRGSFATVYQGVHTVSRSLSSVCQATDANSIPITEIENLCSDQVRQLVEA
jgi:serine/threonine protein kinase